MKILETWALACLASLLLPLGLRGQEPQRVACIGNSITFGLTLDDPATGSYPAQLQIMLDNAYPGQYDVRNFGLSGATLLRHGHRPYDGTQQWRDAKDFKPDIAVMHLGINDTDPRNWPHYGDEFVGDYLALIDTLRMINPDVKIIIANLTPIKASHRRFEAGTRQWLDSIRATIPNVAKAADAMLIDFNNPMHQRMNLLPDGIHPNKEGLGLLAQKAYGAITGEWGGLQLPAVYADGMVMQREQFLPIRGRANAHAPISVEIGGLTYLTEADDEGYWQVTINPLYVGEPYTMVVSDGKDTITISDILAGEVWLASGQSNMEFKLKNAVTAASDIAGAADPLLRFYYQEPIALTNNYAWSDEERAEVDHLRYFLPGKWQQAEPESVPDWSAVAYHFARTLRDSLDVPVGIIQNAVGGSPTEAWIDIVTLEDNISPILLDWKHNHYLQPWVKQRAIENVGEDPLSRHPYEPSYLFSAAIDPLGKFPIKGAIWYQGESNAHNTELHEQLFGLLLDSWRGYWDNPDMPVVFAQLSSINRPSWPVFRDSQRRLALKLPHTAMAVTSDLGDSLDVHPRHKREVGERMALGALHEAYGRSIEYSGPQLASVVADGGKLLLVFDHAQQLSTADGGDPIAFEIAEIDGVYAPAEVEIVGNTIILSNKEMKCPKYVRYGWQPFTRANLVNESGLPASTFKAKVSNASDFEMEPGLDKGVSAAFSGMLFGKLVLAGGCNFPEDPLGAASQKKFYQGIYAADPQAMQWQRIGSLPAPMAYGMSATVPQGIVMVGGNNADGATTQALLLTADGIEQLPSLPVAIDNAYAASAGSKVYVVGGNGAGVPSKAVYSLDLLNLAQGWTRLKDMPGNPRVQPVAAVAKNADGDECLYVFGGFAPRHVKNEPTLNTDGLCLNLRTGRWSAMPAPVADSEEISLGGGVAAAVGGKIAACGGVNKDVFLSALQNQPADYLQHPESWYKFNPYLLEFDPATLSWSVLGRDQDTARAGASLICDGDTMYVVGGEVKPRIRTPQIIKTKLEY